MHIQQMTGAHPGMRGGTDNARAMGASAVAFFVAFLTSAILLGPALAHAFELPNKIDLPRDQYFVVQQVYRGWSLFGFVLPVQVVALRGGGTGCFLDLHLSSECRDRELDGAT